ncbi:hypothetical protein SFRURICE_015354 [Spodoptera frugiperda]|nr:hypothetical protein SFRURICE_015354 [Spodoptera frugiperda]
MGRDATVQCTSTFRHSSSMLKEVSLMLFAGHNSRLCATNQKKSKNSLFDPEIEPKTRHPGVALTTTRPTRQSYDTFEDAILTSTTLMTTRLVRCNS